MPHPTSRNLGQGRPAAKAPHHLPASQSLRLSSPPQPSPPVPLLPSASCDKLLGPGGRVRTAGRRLRCLPSKKQEHGIALERRLQLLQSSFVFCCFPGCRKPAQSCQPVSLSVCHAAGSRGPCRPPSASRPPSGHRRGPSSARWTSAGAPRRPASSPAAFARPRPHLEPRHRLPPSCWPPGRMGLGLVLVREPTCQRFNVLFFLGTLKGDCRKA